MQPFRFFRWTIPEDNSRQYCYALGFTLAVHLFLVLLLVGNIHWRNHPEELTPIEAVFVDARPATPAMAPSPIIPDNPPEPVEPTPPLIKQPPKTEPPPEAKTKTKEPKKVVAKKETLPDSNKKATPSKAAEEPKKIAKADNLDKPKDKKKNEPKEVDQLDAMINRVTEDVQTENKPAVAVVTAATPTAATAGKSGENSDAKGCAAPTNKDACNTYLEGILMTIRQKITLPNDIPGNPQIKVSIEQDENGKVQKVTISEKSGNTAFDDAVVRAVYAASPLPRAPKKEIFDKTINLTWHYRDFR